MSRMPTRTQPPARVRWPSAFASLRHRNFRLWFFGQMVSLMGTWMQWVAQGWLVYLLTESKLALGTISFVRSLPTLFLMVPAGALADRVSKRRLLLVTQTWMMALAFALAWLSGTGALQVWHMGFLSFALGMVNSFDAPARQALIVDMVDDRRDVMNAVALNSTLFNVARIVGPAVGGVILAALGPTWCFAFNGVSFLAAMAALWAMRLAPGRPPAPSESLIAQISTGLQYVCQDVVLRTMISLSAISALFGFFYVTLLPAIAAEVLRVGEEGLGALNAAIGVGALAGSLLVASLGGFRRKGALLTIGSIVFPLALLVFSACRALWPALIALGVVGFAFIIQNATINTLIHSQAPDALRGRVLSVFALAFFGTSPFAAVQAGALAEALGPAWAVGIGAGVTLAYGAAVCVAVPAIRRLEG